eukprot:11154251-Lingulodinium_polyedra.AAC.1
MESPRPRDARPDGHAGPMARRRAYRMPRRMNWAWPTSNSLHLWPYAANKSETHHIRRYADEPQRGNCQML